jgi:hypothetical protein
MLWLAINNDRRLVVRGWHTCPAITAQVGCTRARADFRAGNETSLFMLYAPERQVDARPSHARLLGHLVLEVLLRVAGHDQQAAVRSSGIPCKVAVLGLLSAKATRRDPDSAVRDLPCDLSKQ